MPDLSVNFMHPTDGGVMTVNVDDAMTAEEVIGELLANNFVPPHNDGYQISIVETGRIVLPNQTLAEAGARNGSKINVIPSAPAGSR